MLPLLALLLVACLPPGAAQDTVHDAAFLTDTTTEAGTLRNPDDAEASRNALHEPHGLSSDEHGMTSIASSVATGAQAEVTRVGLQLEAEKRRVAVLEARLTAAADNATEAAAAAAEAAVVLAEADEHAATVTATASAAGAATRPLFSST